MALNSNDRLKQLVKNGDVSVVDALTWITGPKTKAWLRDRARKAPRQLSKSELRRIAHMKGEAS